MATGNRAAEEPALTVSIVTYRGDREVLRNTLHSLKLAAERLVAEGVPPVHATLIDNGGQSDEIRLLADALQSAAIRYQVECAGANIGYGRAHNLAIFRSRARHHLILNPDVLLDRDSLLHGLDFLAKRPEFSAVAPMATDAEGKVQYLCKSFPSVLVLLLRGFAPAWLCAPFSRRLASYEMRELIKDRTVEDVPLISGCFMLCDTQRLQQVGGFDERYFLYFEDYALSLKLRQLGPLAYLPVMKIQHYGGNSARKGLKHIGYFLSSGVRFFNTFGWKLI